MCCCYRGRCVVVTGVGVVRIAVPDHVGHVLCDTLEKTVGKTRDSVVIVLKPEQTGTRSGGSCSLVVGHTVSECIDSILTFL